MLSLIGVLSQYSSTDSLAYSQKVLSHNPRFYYKFDDATNSTVVFDYSGNNFHGNKGAAISLEESALVNNRGNGHAYLPSSSTSSLASEVVEVPWQLTVTGQFTIEFWFKGLDKPTDQNRGLFGSDQTHNQIRLWYNLSLTPLNSTQKVINFQIEDFGDVFPNISWSPNTIYHVAFQLSTTDAKIYVNGVRYNRIRAIPSMAQRFTTVGSQSQKPTWYIGRGYNTVRNFGGYLSDFAVYDYWLSEAQIEEHYNLGKFV